MLLKDRLRQMFEPFPPDVQRVLDEMLDLEQRRILQATSLRYC